MISTCSTCGTSNWRRTSIDDTGTLAICADGHWNFEAGSGGGSITTGNVTVKGQSAIGNGARAVGRKNR